MREIELLAPASNKDVAKAAIMHGADAVYIGASSHGARKKAGNSIEDIQDVVEFAHRFHARVYVTVNTLVYDNEISKVESLVWNLYRIGVDAIIVQDMSLLKMKLPPIPLHASTQCDTRSVDKAKFLQDVGFSQLVLARELTISEIRDICRSVEVPVECFVHGALCVSYSGRCGASQLSLGRSANRGECAQMCRMPYTLRNAHGDVLEKDRYLLSLRDFNASAMIPEMIEAGVRSFKIEGRLKDVAYVKNVTAFYSQLIDAFIAKHPEEYHRSSCGKVSLKFAPKLDKSFNRGFTDYFLSSRRPGSMASLLTPKSMGEEIEDINNLNNGDGISFFNSQGEYEGINVNGVRNGKIIGNRELRLPKDAIIHRTNDLEWNRIMSGNTSERRIWVDMAIDETGLSISDERGNHVRVSMDVTKDRAQKPMQPERVLCKLGDTIYKLRNFENNLNPDTFIPASQLTSIRRRGIEMLDKANESTYHYDQRRESKANVMYPQKDLDARCNVANHLAEEFYSEHGVEKMDMAYEIEKQGKDSIVMTTRYCILRELGVCKRERREGRLLHRFVEPLTISTGPHIFRLRFDCNRCEMNVIKP